MQALRVHGWSMLVQMQITRAIGRKIRQGKELCFLVVTSFDWRWQSQVMFNPTDKAGNLCPRPRKTCVTENTSNNCPKNQITEWSRDQKLYCLVATSPYCLDWVKNSSNSGLSQWIEAHWWLILVHTLQPKSGYEASFTIKMVDLKSTLRCRFHSDRSTNWTDNGQC